MQAQTRRAVLVLGLQMLLWKGVHVPLVLCHISQPLADGDLSFSMAVPGGQLHPTPEPAGTARLCDSCS